MNPLKKSLWVGLITAVPLYAAAGTYDSSVSLTQNDTWHSSEFVLKGKFYFDPVDDSKGPLAEADFLSRQSSAGVTLVHKDQESLGDTDTLKQQSLKGFEGIWHSDTGFWAQGQFSQQDTTYHASTNVPSPNEASHEWTSGSFGYFINDTTSFGVGYRELQNTTTGDNYRGIRKSGGIRHLMTLDNSHVALYGVWHDETTNNNRDNTQVDVQATYYPAKNIGFTVGLLDTNYIDDTASPGWDSQDFTIGTEYFITPSLAVNMSMVRTEYSDNDSARSQSIGITSRF